MLHKIDQQFTIFCTPGDLTSGNVYRFLNNSRLRIWVLPANVSGPAALDRWWS